MVKVSALPVATSIAPSDVLLVVQGGQTKRIAASLIAPAGGAPGQYPIGSYGAVSDGVTDDSLAISNAGKAASDAGGGTVVFPTGTTGWANVTFYPGVAYASGPFGGAVLRRLAPSTPTVLAANTVFRGLTFTRGSVGSHILLKADSILVENCTFREDSGNAPTDYALNIDSAASNVVVRSSRFIGLKQSSIFAFGAPNLTIERNTVVGQTIVGGLQAAFQTQGPCTGLKIVDNRITIATGLNYAVNGIGFSGTNVDISRNHIACSRFSIEGGNSGNRTDGSSLGGITGSISGNKMTVNSTPYTSGQNYAAGISLPYATGASVEGNTIDQTGMAAGTTGYCSIELPDASFCTVSGNVMLADSKQSMAIMLDGAFGNTIVSNTMIGHYSGVNVFGHGQSSPAPSSDNVISGNRIVYSGTYALGGGVQVNNDQSGSTNRNIITGNRISGSGAGYGVVLNKNNSSGTTEGNRVAGNIVTGATADLYRSGDTGTILT